MAWDKPSLGQLIEQCSRDFSSRLQNGAKLLPWSVEAVLAKVWAGMVFMLHGFIAWCFKQCHILSAESYYLKQWARVWGIFGREAGGASGEVVFQAPDGVTLEAGAILLHSATQERYATQKEAVAENGLLRVLVKSLDRGAHVNLAAGESVQVVEPVAGLTGQGVVMDGGITGGVDAEDVESLRARLLARIRKPPRGGAKHDYVFWAKEVSGVTRAWVYPHMLGVGTVGVGVVCDNAEPIYPNEEKLAEIYEYIESVRPASVKELSVFAPEPFPITVLVEIVPKEDDTKALREAISRELHDVFYREAEPGATLPVSHIREAISITTGEYDHILHGPLGNVEIPEGCLGELDLRFVERGAV